jgi:hypothetical protein
MYRRYLAVAAERFDRESPIPESDWEEVYGARHSREFLKWCEESEFTLQSTAGSMSTTTFG